MTPLAINGKFLGAPLNGVHRTAAHYSAELIARAGDAALLTPRSVALDPPFAQLSPKVVRGIFGAGQGWEMLTLPFAAKGALLVNFCNLAPLLHPNTVVMIHDAQTYLYPEDYSGRQSRAYRRLLPLIARRARRVLTVSEFARRSLAANGISPLAKTDVVMNGTDHILGIDPAPDILAHNGLAANSYALALGSTKGYKNLRRLFQAFADSALADRTLVVAGGPPAAAYRAKGWTPPDNVRFLGFVNDAALRALYEGATMFLFPSQTEGFGLPPAEAMQCGAPVIAANAGAMPEVTGDAALLVDPDDTGDWIAAITALGAPELQAKHRALGRTRAAQLTWRQAGDRLWSVIEPMLRK